jgi:glycosyltransferase involved in cell wall biosynthesis
MNFTAAICVYNAEQTIKAAVESVLRQELQPIEFLVVDDGSTDGTVSLIESFGPRVTLLKQQHGGVSDARNKVCREARGDFIAFLDSDDIWHPSYLRAHAALARQCSDASAFFTGHVNFSGCDEYAWNESINIEPLEYRTIPASEFIASYNRCPSPFNSMSFCSIPTELLRKLGTSPFPPEVGGVEDTYLLNVLPNLAPVVAYTPAPLVAYRISDSSLSADRLRTMGLIVAAFELLAKRRDDPLVRRTPLKTFNMAFAAWRRSYARFLLGVGRIFEARSQLWRSVCFPNRFVSVAKSLVLLLLTYLPGSLHPQWPSRWRQVDC